MMDLERNAVSSFSHAPVIVTNGADGSRMPQRILPGLMLSVEKVDRALAGLRAQVEDLHKTCGRKGQECESEQDLTRTYEALGLAPSPSIARHLMRCINMKGSAPC